MSGKKAAAPMRPLIEIGIVVLLVAFGWNQSFRDQWARITGRPQIEAPRKSDRSPAAAPRQLPAPRPRDTGWMWAPSKLDSH